MGADSADTERPINLLNSSPRRCGCRPSWYGDPVRRFVIFPLLLTACAEPEAVCGDFETSAGQLCFSERDSSTEWTLALGDAGNDGRVDAIVFTNEDFTRVAVQQGQADGTFAAPGPSLALPVPPQLAFVDSTGPHPEVLLLIPDGGQARVCSYAMGSAGSLAESWCHPIALMADEGSMSLRAGALGPNGEHGFALASWERVVVVIDPAGLAIERQLPRTIGTDGRTRFEVADLDGNGQDELLLLADGAIERQAAPWNETLRIPTSANTVDFSVVDIDCDGSEDLVVEGMSTPQGAPIELVSAEGSTLQGAFASTDGFVEIFAADIDGDHRLELLGVGESYTQVMWGHVRADEGVLRAERLGLDGPAHGLGQGVVAVDVNGDGVDDLMNVYADDVLRNGHLPWRITGGWVGDP